MRRRLIPVLLFAVLLCGCPRPWDTARTVVVEPAAEGVAEADEAVVEAYEASSCDETEDVAELRQCIERLRDATTALQAARAAVREAESLVDAWEQGGTEPTDWVGWLTTGGQALARLVELLDAAGVPVPGMLRTAAEALDAYLESRGGAE